MLFVLALFLACTIYAQNDWTNGFVITNNGDTLTGFVDNRGSQSNGFKCCFKKDSATKIVTEYKPNEIAEYNIGSYKHFISKNVSVDGSDQKLVFLEYLVKGKVALYHYRDLHDYYFVEKDAVLKELKPAEVGTTKRPYVGVLNYVLAEANISDEIERTRFDAEPLANVVKLYHDIVCPGDVCMVYKNPKRSCR